MRAVNLLPRDTALNQSARRVDPLLAGGAALTAVVVVAIGGGFFLVHSHAASAQKKLATARAQLTVLEAAARQAAGGTAPVLPTPTVTQAQAPWQSAVTSALQTRVPWDGFLAQLARVVPANVSVSTVTLGGGSAAASSPSPTTTPGTPATPPPATASAGSLQIGGTAFSQDGVAQLLSRLALVPNLSNVALTSSSIDSKTGHDTFTISAQVGVAPASVTALAGGPTP